MRWARSLCEMGWKGWEGRLFEEQEVSAQVSARERIESDFHLEEKNMSDTHSREPSIRVAKCVKLHTSKHRQI